MFCIHNSLSRVAKLVADRHNIQVIFKPGVPSTTESKITLPPVPEGADQGLLDSMQGYLDQQVGYALYSDLSQVKKLRDRQGEKAQAFYAVFKSIEDLRVEESMEALYPGCSTNLKNMHSWFLQNLVSEWGSVSELQKVLECSFLMRRYPGNRFIETVDDEVRDMATGVSSLLNRLRPQTTSGSVLAARKVYEMLFGEEHEYAEEQDQLEGCVLDTAGDSAGKEDGPNDTGHGGPQGSRGPEELREALSGYEQGDQRGRYFDGRSVKDSIEGKLSDLGESLNSNAEQEIQRARSKSYGYDHNQQSEGYSVYSTEEDFIGDLQKPVRSEAGQALSEIREESARVTSVMRRRLVNSLRAAQNRRWVGGRSEGRLDTRRAYKAIQGISNDVYKVRTSKVSLDTAVALAIDHSGSMAGDRLYLSGQSAITLGDVFDPLGIPFMVYGFSTRSDIKYPRLAYEERSLYGRSSWLWIGHYKRFEEPWSTGALRLSQIKDNCQRNTIDGESILYGARQLLARPEKRKILIVFNDGAPFPGQGDVGKCQTYLKKVVKDSINAGIEIIAFGIFTDEVSHYYPDWVQIDSLEDLVREPLNQIDSKLRKGLLKSRGR